MNKECDSCMYCKYYKDKEIYTGFGIWMGKCTKFKIKRNQRSESCDSFDYSKEAINNFKVKPERVEHGGTRESERFD